MIDYQIINRVFSETSKAKKEFEQLTNLIDQDIVELDKNAYLFPATLSSRNWSLSFEFTSKFKQIATSKYEKLIIDTSDKKDFESLSRRELINMIAEKDIDIDIDDYSDTDDLRDAVGNEYEDDDLYETDKAGDKFESIGVCLWQSDKADSTVLCLFIEMDSDESSWGLIKKIAKDIGGEIILHDKDWDWNYIICDQIELKYDLKSVDIAQRIIQVLDKIIDREKD